MRRHASQKPPGKEVAAIAVSRLPPRVWARVARVKNRTDRFSALGATAAFLATAATMLVLDLAWLGIVARGLYTSALGHLMRPEALWPAALLFYVFYVSVITAGGLRHWTPAAARRGLRGL
jgi:hypothetical protein